VEANLAIEPGIFQGLASSLPGDSRPPSSYFVDHFDLKQVMELCISYIGNEDQEWDGMLNVSF
jgi:hypothetical protein